MARTHSRLRRLYWIDAALRQGDSPSAASLARELGVARGTIHRDLQILREQYRAPLTYDPSKGVYTYGHPFRPELPGLPAEEALDLAHLILRRGQLRDSALGDSLRVLREQICGLLPGEPAAARTSRNAPGGSPADGGSTGPAADAGEPRAWRRPAEGATSEDTVSILLRFDPTLTRQVLDSGFFAPREVQLLTNGGFEATVVTQDPDAFLLSLLRWAPHFDIVGPPWVRRRLPQLLRRLLRQLEGRKPRRRNK